MNGPYAIYRKETGGVSRDAGLKIRTDSQLKDATSRLENGGEVSRVSKGLAARLDVILAGITYNPESKAHVFMIERV